MEVHEKVQRKSWHLHPVLCTTVQCFNTQKRQLQRTAAGIGEAEENFFVKFSALLP
jgi:hypothetical protein